MDLVQIGSYLAVDSLRRRLFFELDEVRGRGVRVSVRCRRIGDLSIIECSNAPCSDRLGGRVLVRRAAARAVAGLVFNDLEFALVSHMVKTRRPDLSADELETVSKHAVDILNEGVDGFLDPVLREEELASDLEEFLSEWDLLVVEGFVRFRMREYFREMERSVEEALARLISERERREFVRLLKCFVELQEQREEEVHVVRANEDGFQLLDSDGRRIEGDYVSMISIDLLDDGVEMVDLLLSALITVAPARVVLHFEPGGDIAEAIDAVFAGKVRRCEGCSMRGCEMGPVTSVSVPNTGLSGTKDMAEIGLDVEQVLARDSTLDMPSRTTDPIKPL